MDYDDIRDDIGKTGAIASILFFISFHTIVCESTILSKWKNVFCGNIVFLRSFNSNRILIMKHP